MTLVRTLVRRMVDAHPRRQGHSPAPVEERIEEEVARAAVADRTRPAVLAVGADVRRVRHRQGVLPDAIRPVLERHLAERRLLHARDLARDEGKVPLPHALVRRLPGAASTWP